VNFAPHLQRCEYTVRTGVEIVSTVVPGAYSLSDRAQVQTVWHLGQGAACFMVPPRIRYSHANAKSIRAIG